MPPAGKGSVAAALAAIQIGGCSGEDGGKGQDEMHDTPVDPSLFEVLLPHPAGKPLRNRKFHDAIVMRVTPC